MASRPAKSAWRGRKNGASSPIPEQAAQQGRGVGGVACLLGGPEGTRLGELALTLLGECLGHGGAYLGGGA